MRQLSFALALMLCASGCRSSGTDGGAADAATGPAAASARDARRMLRAAAPQGAVRPPVAQGVLVPTPIAPHPTRTGQFLQRRADSIARFDETGFRVTGAKRKQAWTLEASFDRGRPTAPIAEQPLPGRVHHYVGAPAAWKTGLPTYAQLAWEDVWPGVDVVVREARAGFEYGFIVAPGARLDDVALRWEGATRVVDAGQGGLSLETGIGTLRLTDLRAWTVRDGAREARTIRHRVTRDPGGAVRVGFVVDGWDGREPLVIDPSVTWSSYWGGASYDDAVAMGVDSTGAALLGGGTMSADAPVTPGAFDGTLGSFYDGWVGKVSAGGSLVWATYLGGGFADEVRALAVDKADATVVTGVTGSSDFATKSAAYTTLGGMTDAFVTKLDSSGALVFSTYFGGSGDENQPSARGLAVDASNAIVVAGSTRSGDLPLKGAFDATYAGGTCPDGPCNDAFVARFTAAGALVFSSYLGGGNEDGAWGVAVDGAGAAVIAGTTESSDFPRAGSGTSSALSGKMDAFVTKVSALGAIEWSTFFGGSLAEQAFGLGVDAAGAVFVTGSTSSTDLPLTAGAFDKTFAGPNEGFVFKLDASGARVFSSYLGGASVENPYALAVDPFGAVYVAGETNSPDFGVVNGFDMTPGGADDGFVVKLSNSGALIWSSYFGGSAYDTGRALATSATGALFVAGTTQSSDFSMAGAFDSTFGPSHEAFVFRVTPPAGAGSACTNAWECPSGLCADGVCCDRACTGVCEACTAAKKGGGADGTCGLIKDGVDPDAECTAASCSGTTLTRASVCNGSGACRSDGASSCGDYRCKAGACPTTCVTSADCSAGTYCKSSACVPLEALGKACGAARDCASGFCADGLCCDKACTGACEACSNAKKGSGPDGACAPVAADTDPKGLCDPDPLYPDNCKADGLCDGKGACRAVAKAGTGCGATTCAAGAVTGRLCDAAGTCTSTSTSCAPYASCADGARCKVACAVDGDCASTHFCGATGACVEKKKAAEGCGAAKECGSGFCVDSVCCDTACSGQCEACDVSGKAGTCSAVTGAPRGGRAACDGDPAVCGGACNGVNRDGCGYEPSTRPCGAACSAGSETTSTCDGKGACVAAAPRDCAPYVCDASVCKKACAAEGDCTTGYACEASKCVPKASKCSDDGLSVIDASGASSLCGGGATRCRGGACVEVCATSEDCAPGFLCDGGACKKSEAASADDGGCSMTHRGSPSALVALLLCGLAARARRSRAARG